jgi:hypothetical protein
MMKQIKMANDSIFPLQYDNRRLKRRRSKHSKEDPNPICDKLNTLDRYIKPSNSPSKEEPT